MRKIAFFTAFMLLFAAQSLFAQRITAEKSFKVNYPINQVGYPSQIVPNKDNNFTYVEYWVNGEEHRYTNYYVQTYNPKFEEVWFRPVTKDNDPQLANITDVVRLNDGVAVIGQQYSAGIKRMATKMQLFELNGREKGSLQMISTFTKKAKKGYLESISVSPDQKSLFWMGHNPGASAKKRDVYCSVSAENGTKLWGKRLVLEPFANKYKIKQATVDNRGNAYFYMVYESATNTLKDTVNLPKIVRYDFKANTFSTYAFDFKGYSVPEGMIKITDKGDLAFVGILSDASENGFLNGVNYFSTPLKWNKIAYLQFNVQRELEKKQEAVMDVPEAWIAAYKEKGADFSKMELLETEDKLFWVMEEFYVTDHNGRPQHRYYDVAVVGIDIKTAGILWATSFDKQQRDYIRGEMLSYVAGFANGQLHFVYLNERGAQGKIICSSIDLKSGAVTNTDLVRNEREDFLFFPRRSAMISKNKMMLMGVGSTERNDYKLIEVSFDEF